MIKFLTLKAKTDNQQIQNTDIYHFEDDFFPKLDENIIQKHNYLAARLILINLR